MHDDITEPNIVNEQGTLWFNATICSNLISGAEYTSN